MTSFIANAFTTTVSNVRSNKQIFLISTGTIAVSLSILGVFLVVFFNLNGFAKTWNKQVQLIVYLEDDISQSMAGKLKEEISSDDQVASITYISREEAWKQFRTTLSGKSQFLSDLEFNPLPASYNIQFKHSSHRLESIRTMAIKLRNREGVETLEFGERWVSRFERFLVLIRIFIFAVGGLLSLGLIFIISNTIKLSIYSRQAEVELMLLIGATHRFIRVPFLLEGVLQGGAGSLIALALVKTIHWYAGFQFQDSIESITRGVEFQFLSWVIILGMFLGGMFIGWIGSWTSINQFLHADLQQ